MSLFTKVKPFLIVFGLPVHISSIFHVNFFIFDHLVVDNDAFFFRSQGFTCEPESVFKFVDRIKV